MRFAASKKHYKLGRKRPSQWLRYGSVLLAIILLVVGVYLLIMSQKPTLLVPDLKPTVIEAPEEIKDKQVIIPKIGVNVEIKEGDQSVLKTGAWHRFPERGDPEKGGNFIVSGHRFVMGYTPKRTKEMSFFYNIDKLAVGDTILIDWQKTRYEYKITKIHTVKPNQVEIENPSDEAKLTLYTCTLNGSNDGRVVLVATKVQ